MINVVVFSKKILHTLYYMLHTEHAYYLSYRFLNNVVITTVIEMVELVEILDGRLGKRSVERVRYVINNLLHLVIVKYGDISLILCISTRLRLVTILSLLVKYLVIGERAKRARHSQVCSIENRIYFIIIIVRAIFVPVKKAERNFEIATRTLCLRVCGAKPRFTAAVKISLLRQHFSSRILLDRKLSESYFF